MINSRVHVWGEACAHLHSRSPWEASEDSSEEGFPSGQVLLEARCGYGLEAFALEPIPLILALSSPAEYQSMFGDSDFGNVV
jgi:hypothetical protein